jgi:hypothetical protein
MSVSSGDRLSLNPISRFAEIPAQSAPGRDFLLSEVRLYWAPFSSDVALILKLRERFGDGQSRMQVRG